MGIDLGPDATAKALPFLVNLEDESCWDSQRADGVQATPLFSTLRSES
jgi:hypothetical protein